MVRYGKVAAHRMRRCKINADWRMPGNDERTRGDGGPCAFGIPLAAFQRLVIDDAFPGKPPLPKAVLEQKPKTLDHKRVTARIIDKLLGLVDDGSGALRQE